jgi:hypothetical protein
MVYNGNMAVNTLSKADLPDNIRLYKNGALFDKNKGRIVGIRPDLAEKNTQITPQNSGDLLAIRLDKKRNTIQKAAQAAVQSSALKLAHGSDAWIAEIAQAQMMVATTPDAGVASTKAAEWLINNAGLGERQAVAGDNSGTLGALSDVIGALSAFAGSIAGLVADNAFDNSNYHNQSSSVVDADAVPVDSGSVDGDTVQASDTGEDAEGGGEG